MKIRSAFLALVAVLCLIRPVGAHPEGFSGIHATIDVGRIRVAITVHTRDMDAWFPPAKYPDYVAGVTAEMEDSIDEIVELQIEGEPQPIVSARAFLLEVGLIEIDVDYDLPASSDGQELLLWSKHLIHLPRGHQQLLFIEDRRGLAGKAEQGVILLDDVLSVDRDAAAVILPSNVRTTGRSPAGTPDRQQPTKQDRDQDNGNRQVEGRPSQTDGDGRQPHGVATANNQPTSRISFFRFGMEHILSGYDHLLFLAALLLVCRSFLDAAKIVTCFTVAHSITLALASLEVVHVSGDIVEPVIALSIVYVAVENLMWVRQNREVARSDDSEVPGRLRAGSTQRLWRRMGVTFLFGLIHGLGFASALRELGLQRLPGGVLWPLLKFNLGVEAGQLCVAAVLFPLLAVCKRSERSSYVVVFVGSIVIALAGAYWLVTRVSSN